MGPEYYRSANIWHKHHFSDKVLMPLLSAAPEVMEGLSVS